MRGADDLERPVMPIPNPRRQARVRVLLPVSGVLVFSLLLSNGRAICSPEARADGDSAQQLAGPPQFPKPPQSQTPSGQPDGSPSPLTPKQQRAVLKANYAKMKQDADELAALAKSLQDELDKSNENVLSFGVVEKADKIDKLAKRIKSAAIQ